MSIYKLQVLHNYFRSDDTMACSIESGATTYLTAEEKLKAKPYFIVYNEHGIELSKQGVTVIKIRKVYGYKTLRGYIIKYWMLRQGVEQRFNEPAYCIKKTDRL